MMSNGECEEQPFEIPTLPGGQELKMELLSNWGDETYIGLSAIEVFSETGRRVDIEEVSFAIFSAIICSKGENVKSLTFDAGMSTVWRTFIDDSGRGPDILLKFQEQQKIAMIRVWNYNESRFHAQIGAKTVRLLLDGNLIFFGDINPAYKADVDYEPMGDTVLFTTDETILEAIAENDVCLLPDALIHQSSLERCPPQDLSPVVLTPFRPTTGEVGFEPNKEGIRPHSEDIRGAEGNDSTTKVKVLHFELISNWGHPDLIGITGLGFIGPSGSSLSVKYNEVTISSPASEGGVERLLNGQNLGRNPADMWLTPFDAKKSPVTVTLQFVKALPITGISFWNYNASAETSFAGVKYMNIYVNGKLVVQSILLRKAPGFVYFDFVQDVFFDAPLSLKAFLPRPATHSICGFIFQLKLLSTWGDEFYIGLNGIELFGQKDTKIRLKSQNLAAFPESVNILPAVEGDPRTSDNLITGPFDTDNPSHMWLTPLLPNRCARVFFIFDVPTFVSKVTLYNYRKTPIRGVRHVSLSVDDIIVFSGEVPQSTEEQTGVLSIDLRDF